MLTKLSVSNFAIIDNLQLQFQRGLTIITGETGAGKSILLGALRLILGERADLKQLNNQEKKCVIEAHFDVSKLELEKFFEENDLDYEPQSILRRELLPSGKSRAFVNDTPVTLHILQELSGNLIDIHSQFNTANLLEQDYQLNILDGYAGQIQQVKNYQSLYSSRAEKNSFLSKLRAELDQASKESDYKNFLWQELDQAQLKADEWNELEKEQKELQNVDEIQTVLAEIQLKLDTPEFGILSQLHELSTQINKISGLNSDLEDFSQRIQSTKIELDDIQKEISFKIERLEANPERLNLINDRMDLIQSLLSKHRVTSVEELIAIQHQLESENSNLQELEQKIEQVEKDIQKLDKDLNQFASEISKQRKSVIPAIEKEVVQSLSKLGMENSVLKIDLKSTAKLNSFGMDHVEFLFSANKGSTPKSIEKNVSGGERSRLMLAIKKLMAGKMELPTLILDEIDTGVSGKVANEVGNLMKEMAEELQLISITHLPQVAAKASHHFKVQKKEVDGVTTTQVFPLTEEDRTLEIAELLSGSNITETAINQAKELMNS
ncbi:DNA repair protein RecN [Moheibacter stercoris]|uniref:DNA repair protein RecN n=1 Tax=Moheibacter stercoris TaxID=1628251 RepID=A0ABV2LVA4_9FLAO